MLPIAAVVFDLDGTLCTHSQPADQLYEETFAAAGIDRFGTPDQLWDALNGSPPPDDEQGYLAGGFVTVAAQEGRTPIDALALADGFISAVDRSAVSFTPHAQTVLEQLANEVPLGLLTNGPEHRQRPKVDALGIEPYFETIVYAGDLSRRKPNAEPFHAVLSALDVDAANALYVGNSLRLDIAGAQGCGMQSAWYAPAGESPGPYRPQYVLRSLAELVEVVEL